MTQRCLPARGPRRRRGPIVVLILILVLTMSYTVALLWLDVSAEVTVAVLSAVAASTIQLCRSLQTGPRRRPHRSR